MNRRCKRGHGNEGTAGTYIGGSLVTTEKYVQNLKKMHSLERKIRRMNSFQVGDGGMDIHLA